MITNASRSFFKYKEIDAGMHDCVHLREKGRKIASIARSWHQDAATVHPSIRFGEEEHRSRLVNGFSAIELRGVE